MSKSKKTIFHFVLCALVAFCAGVGLLCFGGAETAYAEETVYDTITVKAYDKENREIQLYCENQTLVNWESAFRNIQKQYPDWDNGTYHDFKCYIDLHATIGIDSVDYGNLPMPIELNLHGYTLQLNYPDYWEIYHGLVINGKGGKLLYTYGKSFYQDATFWIRGGDLNVFDTACADFNTSDYPLFFVDTKASRASFVNCSFTNCRSAYYGGAICMDETSYLYLYHCTFDNCFSEYGGAIYLEDMVNDKSTDVLYAEGCSFTNCTAVYYGGVLYAYYNRTDNISTFHFWQCTINDCHSTFYDGGAIYMDCAYGSVNLFRSSITNCSAPGYGGAVFCAGAEFSSVEFGEISGCSAKYGGGIYFDDKTQMLSSTSIHDCKATKEGGAYYMKYTDRDSRTYVSECSFENNSPSDGNATLLSEGSLAIVFGILAGVLLITAAAFIVLYVREKKKSEDKG